MSSFIRAAYNPRTERVEPAIYWDDYFGRHEYGVNFGEEEKVYRPEEVEIPTDQFFYKDPNRIIKDASERNKEALERLASR